MSVELRKQFFIFPRKSKTDVTELPRKPHCEKAVSFHGKSNAKFKSKTPYSPEEAIKIEIAFVL